MDAALLSELMAMGFAVNRATRALHTTGTSSLEQAINWIMEHDTDADIDEPLLVRTHPERERGPWWAHTGGGHALARCDQRHTSENRTEPCLRWLEVSGGEGRCAAAGVEMSAGERKRWRTAM